MKRSRWDCLSHWSSFRDGSHSTNENPGKPVHDSSECFKLLTSLGIGLASLLSKAWQAFNPWQKHLLDIYCKIFIQMQVLSCRIDSWSNMLASLDHHVWVWLALLSFSYLLLLDHGWCFYFCWTELASSRLVWFLKNLLRTGLWECIILGELHLWEGKTVLLLVSSFSLCFLHDCVERYLCLWGAMFWLLIDCVEPLPLS